MHFTQSMLTAFVTLVPLTLAASMQYGQFSTPDGVSQKIGWISGMDVCTNLVPVLAEGGQNACDQPFTFQSLAAGYTFTFINCDQSGVPHAMTWTQNGGSSGQEQGDGFSEPIYCSGGQQFTQGELANQFSLPF
jgi:hypothetical protein